MATTLQRSDHGPSLSRWRPGAGLMVMAVLATFVILVLIGLLTDV